MPWDDGIDWGIDDPLYPNPGDNIDAGGGWNPGAPDDPYANWGGGANGDGSEIFNGGAEGTGMLTGGGGFDLSKVLSGLGKALGLTSKDGSLDLGGLLSLAALLSGGVNSINATGKASQQMQDAANKANQQATDTLQPAMDNYKPYIAAGQDAIGKMANFDTSPLGAKFVAAGPQSNLAAQFNSGRGLSLGQLARKA